MKTKTEAVLFILLFCSVFMNIVIGKKVNDLQINNNEIEKVLDFKSKQVDSCNEILKSKQIIYW